MARSHTFQMVLCMKKIHKLIIERLAYDWRKEATSKFLHLEQRRRFLQNVCVEPVELEKFIIIVI